MIRNHLGHGIKLALFAILCMGVGATVALAEQAHMISAKNDLYSARTELSQATTDKGGYRTRAMKLVNQAIDAVNDGIKYANTH